MPIVANALPAAQVANTSITTPQIFPVAVGYPPVASSTTPALLTVAGSGRFSGARLKVVGSGWATVGGASPTLAINVYSGTSLTPGSNTSIWASATSAALTTSKTYPFFFEVTLEGDTYSASTSTTPTGIQGFGQVKLGDLPAVPVFNDIAATNIQWNFNTEPVATLCCAVTFGVANAANVAQLNEFYVYVD
jgi:hypothetical protein